MPEQNEVKRFTFMDVEATDEQFVLFSDYAALQAKCTEQEKRIKELEEALGAMGFVGYTVVDCKDCDRNADIRERVFNPKPKTEDAA